MKSDQSFLVAFWSPCSFRTEDYCLDYFSAFLKKFGDVQCIDCKNSQEPRILHLLRHMDLVVVGLRQNYYELGRFVTSNVHRFVNCVYLIIDYFALEEISFGQIRKQFRIPRERLVCIPYNERYHAARRAGRGRNYLLRGGEKENYEAGAAFWQELEKTGLAILHALDL